MMNFSETVKEIIMKKADLFKVNLDIAGKDIVIGFNEAAFKKSDKHLEFGDLDSKLNARLVSYFLPAVQLARMQKRKTRLFVISGVVLAMKWNAKTEEQKKIMMVNNKLKLDFLQKFFEKYFYDYFSVVEFVISNDPVKIPEEKLLFLWNSIEKKYPNEVFDLKLSLARFVKPKLFNDSKKMPAEAIKYISSNNTELLNSFKYAVSHLFGLGDLNFEGGFILPSQGLCSIGGRQEQYFNILRDLVFKSIDSFEEIFERKVFVQDNYRLVLEEKEKVPPPYNGFYGKKNILEEVSYENGYDLDFYDQHPKLKFDMQFVYDKFLSKEEYKKFWNEYKDRYFDLKNRLEIAYELKKR